MKQLFRDLHRAQGGATAAEFALVLPLIGTMLFSIIKFGIVYNNYLALTAGVANAERQFAVGRTSATAYSDAVARFTATAPSLAAGIGNGTLTLHAYVSPNTTTPCDANAACASQLTTAATNNGYATFKATYTVCDLVIMGVNYAPNCTLTATATERVE